MKDHKLYELTVSKHGFRFRHANPNPLSAGQKFWIVMALIGAVSFIGFFALMTGH